MPLPTLHTTTSQSYLKFSEQINYSEVKHFDWMCQVMWGKLGQIREEFNSTMTFLIEIAFSISKCINFRYIRSLLNFINQCRYLISTSVSNHFFLCTSQSNIILLNFYPEANLFNLKLLLFAKTHNFKFILSVRVTQIRLHLNKILIRLFMNAFLKWTIPGLFLFIFIFSIQLIVNK